MPSAALTLRPDDPAVLAAQAAEARLFAHYDLAARGRCVLVPRIGLHVRVSEIGQGEPVLFVPGNAGDAFALASLFAELRDHRVIALNRPGGGLSEGIDHGAIGYRELAVTTTTTVLDALGLDSVHVVGHSIGAHWSLFFALEKPERVRSLTLLGSPGLVLDARPPLIFRLLSLPVVGSLVYPLAVPRREEDALRGLRLIGHSAESIARQPAALASCYYHFPRLPHNRTSVTSLMRMRGIHLGEAELARVSVPALQIWGGNDPFASVATGEKIARAMPLGRVHTFPRAGHLPWLDEPAETGWQLRGNFARASRARVS